MKMRTLGNDLTVSALGLGCMGMTGVYGSPVDKAEMIALIHAAHGEGLTFFDTAEAYGPFANEELVGEALQPIRDSVVIATKFGFDINLETGARSGGTNSQPGHIKAVAEAALTDRIGCRNSRLSKRRIDDNEMTSNVCKVGAICADKKSGRMFGCCLRSPAFRRSPTRRRFRPTFRWCSPAIAPVPAAPL